MQMLDAEIHEAKALVIDANPTSRSILVAQLRDFGVGTVMQTSRAQDARRHLEAGNFDLVICDYHFDRTGYSGRDLLDDLRRANLLPYSTVFIMVTGEASYSKVAEAAESALDGYLLRPYSALKLAERLTQARHRKRELKHIFEAIEAGNFDLAARHCQARFEAREQYWLFAARIGAELLLRLGRHTEAQAMFEAVVSEKAAPWARLGIARAQIEAQSLTPAMRTLESLLVDQPTYADAYDVMGRVQLNQGDFSKALETYRLASDITPGSINRLQKQGLLAFFMGEREEAGKALDRAVTLGSSSKMFDFQTYVMLGFIRFAERDDKGLQRNLEEIGRALEKAPESSRLQRFALILKALKSLRERQLEPAVAGVKTLFTQIDDDAFDLEAACNALTLLSHLREAELELPDATAWVEALSQRFCASKASGDMLARAAFAHQPYQEMVSTAHQRVTALAEEAMAHALAGNPARAVAMLLEQGQATRNMRLVDMAALTLQRHKAKIENHDELAADIAKWRSRFAPNSGRLPIDQFEQRPAGGLSLRVNAAPPPPPPAPLNVDLASVTPAVAQVLGQTATAAS